MVWVLKRTVSMRQVFLAPKTHAKTDGQKNNYNFMLEKIAQWTFETTQLDIPVGSKLSAKSVLVWATVSARASKYI